MKELVYREKTCTFFGHKNCPASVQPELFQILDHLISDEDISVFYIGQQGNFDLFVYETLQKLKQQYPHIQPTVVHAYLSTASLAEPETTVFPEGLESVPPKYAIHHRNAWMLRNADIVVCYIEHDWGGAAKYVRSAQRKGKTIINLYHP